MSAGRHDWVVLDSEEAHAQVVGDFVAAGVRRGEQVLVIGLGRREERLWARLRRQGLPTDAAAVTVLPPDPDVLRAAVTAALARGRSGVRFTGALTTPARNAFEPVVAELTADLPLTVLCPYFRELLLPGQYGELTALHDAEHDATAEYDDGAFRLVRDGGVLRLAGELGSDDADALRAVLTATSRSARTAAWDVTDLRFLDADAAETLLVAAAGPPGLTLVGASPATRRLADLVADRHPDRRVRLADGFGPGAGTGP